MKNLNNKTTKYFALLLSIIITAGCAPTIVSVKKSEQYKTVLCSSIEKKENVAYPKNLTDQFTKGNGKKVNVFIDWYDLEPQTKNTIRWEWFHPGGEIMGSIARVFTPTTSHWKSWGTMELDDKYNRSPGQWSVKVFLNNNYICTKKFMILENSVQ